MIAWLMAAVAGATCTVITGVTVHAEDGPVDGRSVVVDGDRVVALGVGMRGLELELDDQQQVSGASWKGASCTFVQGAGKQLTAGLFAAPTHLGLVEVSLESGTRDMDPETEDPIRAGLVVADAYDPRSSLIAVNRMEGITTALTVPRGGFLAGHGAVVSLHGVRQSDAVVDSRAVMVASVPTQSFAEGLRQLRELVSEVKAWARNRRAYDQGRPFPEGASRVDLDALVPVVQGQVPVLMRAERASRIEALIRLQQETGLELVIAGASEGWMVADALATARIPVIVDPLVYGPGGFSQRAGREDNAALLAAAGVPVILTAGFGESHNARTLRQVAGNAVRGGMAHADALQAITRSPAVVFGQRNRGYVGVGAVADLALWSGDPLELSTSLERLWVEGQRVELTSRQRALEEKYLEPRVTAAPLPVTVD